MKKTIHTCDRCGKEITDVPNISYADVTLPLWTGGNDEAWPVNIDLCGNCQKELASLLKHHFMRASEDGKTWFIPDAPYAEIAALETYREDAHKDVEELEEELERLRDVKDKLFEANFALTAQLRAMGVEVDTRRQTK